MTRLHLEALPFLLLALPVFPLTFIFLFILFAVFYFRTVSFSFVRKKGKDDAIFFFFFKYILDVFVEMEACTGGEGRHRGRTQKGG